MEGEALDETWPYSTQFARQPLRHWVISQRAHEQLGELSRDVAARALARGAARAAGHGHAFMGTKRLKRAQEVYSARVDLGHRMLFQLSDNELCVLEVVDCRNLERAIERLRS